MPATGREAPRALTSGTRDSSPRWSPDGKTLAFVRAERDGTAAADLTCCRSTAAKRAPITDLARGAGAPAWSPDGKRIAFSSDARSRTISSSRRTATPKSDVRVITTAVYRSNGGGWNDPDRPSHIWVTDVTSRRRHRRRRRSSRPGKYAESGPGLGARRLADLLHVDARATSRISSKRIRSVRRAGRRRRDDEGRQHQRHDWRAAALARRQVDRVRRHALRHAGAVVRSARSVRRPGRRHRARRRT